MAPAMPLCLLLVGKNTASSAHWPAIQARIPGARRYVAVNLKTILF
jgi:hypothetical protein